METLLLKEELGIIFMEGIDRWSIGKERKAGFFKDVGGSPNTSINKMDNYIPFQRDFHNHDVDNSEIPKRIVSNVKIKP